MVVVLRFNRSMATMLRFGAVQAASHRLSVIIGRAP